MDMIGRDIVLDMLDEIKDEIAEGQEFHFEKWRDYICHYKADTGSWLLEETGTGKEAAWICSNCRQENTMLPTYVWYPYGIEQVRDPYQWPGSNFCPNCGERKTRGKEP